jgi:hypothetical protein
MSMFTFSRIGRAAAAAGAVAALTVGLAACGSGAVAADQVEQQINQLVQERAGQPADSVDCPEDLPAEVGGSIRCTLTAQGETYGVTATVTSVEGSTANYDIKVDDAPSG